MIPESASAAWRSSTAEGKLFRQGLLGLRLPPEGMGASGSSEAEPPSSSDSYARCDAGLTAAPTAKLLQHKAQLRRLDLSGNLLDEHRLTSLVGLQRLQHLTLARCGMLLFPAWTGALPSLERLDLSRNLLTSVPAAAIERARSLECLCLSHNALDTLPITALCALPRLLMVLIDGNAIDIAAELQPLPRARREIFHGAAQQMVPQEVMPRVWLGSKLAAGVGVDGGYHEAARGRAAEGLARRRISHILTVGGSSMAPAYPERFAYRSIELPDRETADIASCLPRCLAFIDAALAAGGTVLVHCRRAPPAHPPVSAHCAHVVSSGALPSRSQGQSRSATVVAAYVARETRCGSAEALARVCQKRYVADPNPGFVRQLRDWCDAGYGAAGARAGAPAALPKTEPLLAECLERLPSNVQRPEESCDDLGEF